MVENVEQQKPCGGWSEPEGFDRNCTIRSADKCDMRESAKIGQESSILQGQPMELKLSEIY